MALGRFFAGLRVRLITLSLLALIPMAGMILYSTFQDRRAAFLQSQADALRLARIIAHDQEQMTGQTRQLLLALSKLPEFQGGDREATCRFLADLLRAHPQYANLGAIALDGTVTCSGLPLQDTVNLKDRAYFIQALETRSFSAGEFQVGRITGKASINFGYPILDSSGSVRSVLFAALDLDWLNQFADQARLPQGVSVTLCDRNGVVLARYPDPAKWIGQRMPEPAFLPVSSDSVKEGLSQGAGLDGVRRLYSTVRLDPIAGEGLFVRIGIPEDLVFARARRAFALSFGWFGLVALMAFGGTCLFGERFILQETKGLVGAARRLASGDLSARSGVARNGGELAELALAFDEMAESLQKRQAERENLERQLLQSQKMEAVGRLAGGIAHDFNNLLTEIIGYSGLALSEIPAESKAYDDIAEIAKAGERASALTRQLLAFSRGQPIEPRIVNLNALVLELQKMLRRLIGEDVELAILAAPSLGAVKVDPGQIEQVVMNLAVNARDAMPKGGRCTIQTSHVRLDKEYCGTHPGVSPGEYVLLSVSDTGTGMSEEAKQHLFEPFFTTKEKGKGTGLGLATCYGIVKRAGGHIAVYSEPGSGTTVNMYLPRLEGRPLPLPAAREAAALRMGTETILIVEDEPKLRELAARMLEAQGYKVLAFSNAEEALELAGPHRSEKVHLLLTDVILPKMGGKELAERLRAFWPGLKVLYSSGYTANVIAHHGVLDPQVQFLQKPYTRETLLRKVREVLDKL